MKMLPVWSSLKDCVTCACKIFYFFFKAVFSSGEQSFRNRDMAVIVWGQKDPSPECGEDNPCS